MEVLCIIIDLCKPVYTTHVHYQLQYLLGGKLCSFEYHIIDFYSNTFYEDLPSKCGINNSTTNFF